MSPPSPKNARLRLTPEPKPVSPACSTISGNISLIFKVTSLPGNLGRLTLSTEPPPSNEQRAAGALTNRGAEISTQLADQGGFPKTFSPEEQGAFALGFYSEKIRRRKDDPATDEKLDEVIPDKTSD